MIAWLEEHDIPLGLEVEPLTWPGAGCLRPPRRLRGSVRAGPGAATSRARRARRVHLARRALCERSRLRRARRLRLPGRAGRRRGLGVRAGASRRPPRRPGGHHRTVVSEPRLTDRDLEIWLDTWEERTGEPFAFLSIDVDWRQEDWPAACRGRRSGRRRCAACPSACSTSAASSRARTTHWLDDMAQHAATFEQGQGVTPDVVGFYTWHPQPDRLLPDDDIDAYTGRINQYFGTRTLLEAPVVEGSAPRRGRLVALDGEPLAGQALAATAEPLDGARSRHRPLGHGAGHARARRSSRCGPTSRAGSHRRSTCASRT